MSARTGDLTIAEVAGGFTQLGDEHQDRFDRYAEVVMSYQREHNAVYRRYCNAVGAQGDQRYPYLPIAAFKQAPVATFEPEDAEHVFESSGTGSGQPSRHYVQDLALYDRAIEDHFEQVVGAGEVVLAAHLPHYRSMGVRSSLLYMIERIIEKFGVAGSGSFLDNPGKLDELVALSRDTERRLVVFGAAFGLLDFVESHPYPLPSDALVIETGGMKTYRREIARDRLHEALAEGFGVGRDRIWSEYGMCELLSQCYTRGGSRFYPPTWMRFQVFDIEDPFHEVDEDVAGMLGLFDLANVYSVSAVLTEDRAIRRGSGFEVIGRLTGAELRGCNFLLENA